MIERRMGMGEEAQIKLPKPMVSVLSECGPRPEAMKTFDPKN